MKIEFDGYILLAGLFVVLCITLLGSWTWLSLTVQQTQVTRIIEKQPIYYAQDIIIEINSTTDEQRIRFNGVEQK